MNSSRSPWGTNCSDDPVIPRRGNPSRSPHPPPAGGGGKLPVRSALSPLNPRFPELDPPCRQQQAEKKEKGRDVIPPGCRRRAMGAHGVGQVVQGFNHISPDPHQYARKEESRADYRIYRLIPRSPSLRKRTRSENPGKEVLSIIGSPSANRLGVECRRAGSKKRASASLPCRRAV